MFATPSVHVWAILGAANAGKSTMIGHLTPQFGATKNGLRRGRADGHSRVLLRSGGFLKIWSRRMALQEAQKSPNQFISETKAIISRQEGTKTQISMMRFNILVALRYEAHNEFPSGDAYLTDFVKTGWKLENLVLLLPTVDHDYYHNFGVPVATINASTEAENKIAWRAGKIRDHFGWS